MSRTRLSRPRTVAGPAARAVAERIVSLAARLARCELLPEVDVRDVPAELFREVEALADRHRAAGLDLKRDLDLITAAEQEGNRDVERWLVDRLRERGENRNDPLYAEAADALEGAIDRAGVAERSLAVAEAAYGESLVGRLFACRAWSRRQFPGQTPASIAAHLQEEAAELAAAPESTEEMADVAMLLWGLADTVATARSEDTEAMLAEAVRAKLEVCRRRVWSENGDGYFNGEEPAAEGP